MALDSTTYHKAVLVAEVIEHLSPRSGSVYVDATFGGGTHTHAILEASPTSKVIALDWDKNAFEKNAPPLLEKFGERFTPVWGNFAHLPKLLEKIGISSVDGILADFGTSQYQIHHSSGFSFNKETPLDMRMSPSHQYFKAGDIVNKYPEAALIKIFTNLGEESFAKQIARAIVEKRKKTPFSSTLELAELVENVIPRKISAKKSIHPATKVFQALRMYVNKELQNIEHFLKASINLLAPQGRLVVISFHSLEDRLVKTFFNAHKNAVTILTKKPVVGSAEEVKANPSSRSAKLRAVQKK